jgi:DNA-binding Lrp family transcriptional regulator
MKVAIPLAPEKYAETPKIMTQQAGSRRSRRSCLAWYVTGDEDCVLVVIARNVGHYDALMRWLVTANANVRLFRALVVLDTLKRSVAVPLDATPDLGRGAGWVMPVCAASARAPTGAFLPP